MEHAKKNQIATVFVLIAVLVLISGAVRRNLSATVDAIAQLPTTIVIDAGHGGEDGGTTGITGASESMLNLEIALRAEQLLAFCGFHTLMIRTSDTAIYSDGCNTYSEKKISDLQNRVTLVNRSRPAILVSIHQNHFPDEQYTGAQVFYAKTDGSRELGQLMQSTLKAALDSENNRPSKPSSSVFLMEKILCPGVLIECGFLSNGREEALLQQENYQKKIVCAIGCALNQYTTRGVTDFEI